MIDHVHEPATLIELAWDLACDGVGGHEDAVRQVILVGREAGVSPILVAVLADPHEPEVARLRAFGHIAAALARRDGRPDVVAAAALAA